MLAGVLLLLAHAVVAQEKMTPQEEQDFRTSLSETGGSALEMARAMERHLEKYPKSPQRAEIERGIVKAAMDAGDKARIVKWGESVLASNMDNPLVLERVAEILLEKPTKEMAERALQYATRFEQILRTLEKEGPSSKQNRAQMLEELDRAIGRALLLRARANGHLGKIDEAIALAAGSWANYETAAAARESAKWLEKAGRHMDAVRKLAEAFTVEDSRNTEEQRAQDRLEMSRLYRKDKDTESGLGDLVLEAYDRTVALAAKRAEIQRERDPNAELKDPMAFTLSSLDGKPLKLESLRGKVIVMDFWATWCGPCRVQHPLYDEVKKRFANREDVAFLSINTDQEQDVVVPFLEANKWSKIVYFEDGLSRLLRISSIPTTVIFDKKGRVFSRMNGFVPERFVDQLTERINEALGG